MAKALGFDKMKKPPRLKGSKRKRNIAKDAIGEIEKLKSSQVENERLTYLERAVGDRQKAKKLLVLWDDYPSATVPELVVIEWLIRRNIKFLYQLSMRGGRVRRGGIVPDLVVFQDPNCLVWQVNGNYWHSRPGAAEQDANASRLLLGQRIEGRDVIAVVALWESRILADADSVCSAALIGIEQGQ